MESRRQLRTRMLDSLNTYEVAEFLERNDVIFLPVGTVEMHGQMPLGAEHVLPLAIAARLAAECDGLILPGVAYSFPGATSIGAGTVMVSPSAGAAYLKEICRSLLRQGFRRQVLLTAHGPAYVTMHLLVREFFEETHCPITYLDMGTYIDRVNRKQPEGVDFDKLIWGAYQLLGRLEEIRVRSGDRHTPIPQPIKRVQRNGAVTGCYYSEFTQHGWWPEVEMDEPARQARAAEGVEQIERLVAEINPRELVDSLRGLDRYHQEEVFPAHGGRLP